MSMYLSLSCAVSILESALFSRHCLSLSFSPAIAFLSFSLSEESVTRRLSLEYSITLT